MHKVRATTPHMHTGLTNRIGVKPWLSWTKCAPFGAALQQKTNALFEYLSDKKTTFSDIVESASESGRETLPSQSPQRKCSKRRRLSRAFASSLRLPPVAANV